jgi:hypothetical protein
MSSRACPGSIDGDSKDVILASEESYRVERDGAMHVFALQACVLEIECEDEVLATMDCGSSPQ